MLIFTSCFLPPPAVQPLCDYPRQSIKYACFLDLTPQSMTLRRATAGVGFSGEARLSVGNPFDTIYELGQAKVNDKSSLQFLEP